MDNVVKMLNSEQVQYLNNYNRPLQNNPYSNTYNPGWRNHPNFGWKDQGNQQRSMNPPDFQSKQPLPESKLAWELAIEKLANVSNDKIEKLASATTQREHVKAIILRSGKKVGDPPVIESVREHESRENKQSSELDKVEENKPQIIETTQIPPPVPFPQKLKPSRSNKDFEMFVNIFKQLHINIPFVDAILQIPSYAKFLEKIMTKKRKLEDSETIALTEECSAIIQNKLPPKLKDPGSFTVSCTIGNIEFSKALCDLGASVSLIPLTVARQSGLKELKRTNISLQLTDRSIRHPMGILENMLIKV
ncbi:uncharacterized protein LOC113759613 [Coffea eugenioides]|uniref:Aspartic peptidase DDI1-type domain-containing protein n=1 Tax=Coffea arabica TaxID=13443 RepID=A0ABM4WQ11_COFAR|nr:uncharacterized protein LOC113759613 [Coffea eugenioides]